MENPGSHLSPADVCLFVSLFRGWVLRGQLESDLWSDGSRENGLVPLLQKIPSEIQTFSTGNTGWAVGGCSAKRTPPSWQLQLLPPSTTSPQAVSSPLVIITATQSVKGVASAPGSQCFPYVDSFNLQSIPFSILLVEKSRPREAGMTAQVTEPLGHRRALHWGLPDSRVQPFPSHCHSGSFRIISETSTLVKKCPGGRLWLLEADSQVV